jgi:hypothetical protein
MRPRAPRAISHAIVGLLCVASCADDQDRADAGKFPPGCHYDCFGYVACRDGVATQYVHAPVPCEFWTGSCPVGRTYQCERGCATDRLQGAGLFACALEICNEHFPKQPGGNCARDEDCRPTRATGTPDGGVTQTYLRCDTTAGRCVETAAPVVSDWLRACDPAVLAGRDKGSFGAAPDPSCSGGVCVHFVPHDQSCIYQGCSKRCRADHDCPAGSVCQDLEPLCGISPPRDGYCKPGPLNLIGAGLPCR